MDVTCNALGGLAALDVACSVAPALGRCCTVLNSQWFVIHYADVADAPLSVSGLQASCESSGSIWYL